MSAAPLACWLLTDGAPGHESQSVGILEALAQEQERHRVLLTIRSEFWRRLGRVLLQLRLPLPFRLLSLAYDVDLPAGAPALVVASGGNTLLAAALIGRRFRAVTAYSGAIKNYPPHTVDLVISVNPQSARKNLRVALSPTPRAVLAVAAVPPGEHLVMLVGGATREYPFSTTDWQALVDGMRALAARSGRRWLVTTSRRSGEDVEALLAAAQAEGWIDACVLWGREPRRVMRDFLERAAQVFVTEDSTTMINEAIWSARPVVSIGVRNATPDEGDARALDGFAQAGLLRRTRCDTLGDTALQSGLQALPPVHEQIADAIVTLLTARR